MTQDDAANINQYLPSYKFKKFMEDNDQLIFDNCWQKVRGSNCISWDNPVYSKNVSFGPEIDSKLMEVREDSGVRIGTLRQELNRRMNLLSFLKSVQTKKLETVYTFLSKSKRMKMLFEHRNLFITTNLDDKQLKGRQLMEQPEFIGILDRVKRELQLLNVTHTDPPNLFIVIQMFMIHKKIIKLKKKSKTQETIVNLKFELEHCGADESGDDSDQEYDTNDSDSDDDDDPYDSAYDTEEHSDDDTD
eukprot:1023293_1